MENRVFRRKSAGEKRSYLAAVLKRSSGGALDDAAIRRILPNVSIHRQYTVSSFADNQAFREAVAHAQTGRALLPVVSSQPGRQPFAVAVTPLKRAGPLKNHRAIYIFAPNPPCRKGATQWARASKDA